MRPSTEYGLYICIYAVWSQAAAFSRLASAKISASAHRDSWRLNNACFPLLRVEKMKRTWSRENEAYMEQRKWSVLGAEKMKRTWSRENEAYLGAEKMKRTWSRENEAYLEQRKWSILGAEKMKRTWSRENETYLEQRNVLYSHTTNIFVHYIRISKGPLIWWFTLFPKKAINTQRWASSIKSVTIKIAIYLVI